MRFVLLALAFCACTVKDPLYCASDVDCDDDTRPYCDLTGETAEAAGHASTCVAYPWDAGPAELCNGVDDDGDEDVDETWPELDDVCTAGMGACLREGAWACTAAQDGVECNATPAEPALMETCYDGIDDDCNGTADDGCPETPVARFPWNGYMTGSVWAPAIPWGTKPIRPSFRWSASAGASSYELQVDDNCTTPGFQDCLFSSPEINVDVPSTSYTAADDLPVSTSAPVGRRYYWRVRGCAAPGCSPWSPVRYVDVGRVKSDLNGDGYSDLVAGAPAQANPTMQEGNVHIFAGSPTGVATPPMTSIDGINGPAACFKGTLIVSVGDVNADGFGDVVAASYRCENDTGHAELLLGGTSVTRQGVVVPTEQGDRFGSAAAGGDLDGDGFADVAISAPGYDNGAIDEGATMIFLGDAVGIDEEPSVIIDNPDNTAEGEFGAGLVIADIDGDGAADLVAGAPGNRRADDARTGAVFFFRDPGATSAPYLRLDGAADGDELGRFGAFAGDTNGDGRADIAIAAPEAITSKDGRGKVYVVEGADIPSLSVTIENPTPRGDGDFGTALAGAGDARGDGLADLLIGAPLESHLSSRDGIAYLYNGNPTGLVPSPGQFWHDPGAQGDARFGMAVAGQLDVNGDGYLDVVVATPYQETATTLGAVFVFAGGEFGVESDPSWTLEDPGMPTLGWSVD